MLNSNLNILRNILYASIPIKTSADLNHYLGAWSEKLRRKPTTHTLTPRATSIHFGNKIFSVYKYLMWLMPTNEVSVLGGALGYVTNVTPYSVSYFHCNYCILITLASRGSTRRYANNVKAEILLRRETM